MKYTKPFCLDTCVFNSVFDLDQNDKIEKLFEKKALRNYIRHHSCIITVLTFFELLRQTQNDFEQRRILVECIQRQNVEVWTGLPKEYDVFTDNYKTELSNPKIVTAFQEKMNGFINDFSAEFYSCIYMFPFLFTDFCIRDNPRYHEMCNKVGVLSPKFDVLRDLIKRKLLLQPEYGNQKKLSILLGRVNKHICRIFQKWSEIELNNFALNPTKEGYKHLFDNVFASVQNEDFQITIVNNGRKYSNEDENPMNWIFKSLCEIPENIRDYGDGMASRFKQKSVELLDKVYRADDSLQKYYVNRSIRQFFLRQIGNLPDKRDAHDFSALVDTNDIIDYINLSFTEKHEMILMSTDKGIIEYVDNFFEEEKKNVFHDFIKPIQTKK